MMDGVLFDWAGRSGMSPGHVRSEEEPEKNASKFSKVDNADFGDHAYPFAIMDMESPWAIASTCSEGSTICTESRHANHAYELK